MNLERSLIHTLSGLWAGALMTLTPSLGLATTLDTHAGLQFTSGGVDYLGLKQLEHEDGVGTIWEAIPKNHDLDVGPVTPVVVLAPDVVTPLTIPFKDPPFQASTTLDKHSGLQFTSGGVDYIGLKLLEHEDGVGTIWEAIPKNHDLDVGPVTPVIVLAPDVVTPLTGPFGARTFEALTMRSDDGFQATTTLDNHSGFKFTSGAVEYLGLEILEHEDGVGTIWLAIPKNHDLETGPVTEVIVLAPDVVTPASLQFGAVNIWQHILRSIGAKPDHSGDVDGDGCASSADFSILLEHFGQSGDRGRGDLDDDGMITIADYAILQQDFGGCEPGVEQPDESGDLAQEIAELVLAGPEAGSMHDSDGDGVPDAFEKMKGSDPNDSADHFRITQWRRTNGGLVLQWTTVAGMAYVIEQSENGEEDSWEPVLSEPIRAVRHSIIRVLPVPVNRTAMLYRIRAETP